MTDNDCHGDRSRQKKQYRQGIYEKHHEVSLPKCRLFAKSGNRNRRHNHGSKRNCRKYADNHSDLFASLGHLNGDYNHNGERKRHQRYKNRSPVGKLVYGSVGVGI